MRWSILIGILCSVSSPAGSASLSIDASVRAVDGGVWFGEIATDGETLLRLRGTDEQSVQRRTDEVAGRLRAFALEGIQPAAVDVTANRAGVSVTIGGRPLVSIDSLLAELSGMSARALAAAWERQLQDCFSKTYLMLEPAELLVPYGEARTIAVGGTATGELACGLYAGDIVAVAPVDDGTAVTVRGLSIGFTAISLDRGDHSALVTVDVRKWAAAIAESAEAVVTGGWDGNPAVRRAVMNAARAAVQPEETAVLRFGRPLPGESRDSYVVTVEATGDSYIPTKREVPVRVVSTASPGLVSSGLLVSNDPELISGPGPLMVGDLPASQAARLLYHHKNNMSRPCRVLVAIDNVSEQEARVHITDAAAGPHPDELFVGHAATCRFNERLRLDHGYVVRVPAGRRVEVESHLLRPDEVTSGLARFTSLNGVPVRITVSADVSEGAMEYFPVVPASVRAVAPSEDRHFEPEKRITASYAVGDAWLFLDIGREAVADGRGSRLQGNYGVWYHIMLQLHNPSEESAKVEIAVRAGGGVAWGSFSIDGDIVETPMLSAGQERLLRTMTLPPGASRTVGVRTMPEAASSYPVTLIVRSP